MPRTGILSLIGSVIAWACTASVGAQDLSAEANSREAPFELTQNSFSGSTGGIRVIDASSGPKGTFRLALSNEFFFIRDFFVPEDRAQHFAGNLSLSVAATDYLEVFASAQVASTWDDSTEPMLVQRIADTLLGVKGYGWVRPWVALGADASVRFPGGIGDTGDMFRASSVGLRANATLDWRAYPRREVPLITRINAQYWFDNTGSLADNVGVAGVLTPFQRFAYGINEVDTFRVGVGLEVPVQVARVGLHPLLDWRWDIPIDRQGFDCGSPIPASGDGCLSEVGVRAYPMSLTVGLRIHSPPKGLAFTLAADVGLTGTRDFVRELAPTVPYSVIVAVGYAIDPRPARRSSPTVGEAPPPRPAMGRIRGFVIDAKHDQPIAEVTVAVAGEPESGELTDASGRFVLASVAPGEVELELRHPNYEAARCEAWAGDAVDSAKEEPIAEVTCSMTPLPTPSSLRIAIVDKKGRPVPAVAVSVRGRSEYEIVTGDEGRGAIDLPPGRYSAHVDDPAYLTAVVPVEVLPSEVTVLKLRVLPRPTRPRVVVRGQQIIVRSRVSFATGSNEILPNSEPLLLEVADVLLRDPSLELVEIQGHTDNRGGRDLNVKLSQARAEAVRDWLVDHGVDTTRLVARGYGPDQPIVPNITAHNRARNRRVQFTVLRRDASGVAKAP